MAKKRVRPKKVKKILPILVLIMIAIVAAVAYYFLVYSSPSSTIANPASTKCLKDGGQVKIINGQLGQSGLCLFPDGTVCDEWAYYRGTCNQGECKRTCELIGTLSEGWYDCNGKLLFYDNCTGENPNTAGTC
jgi:putative hemolysin